MTDFAAVLLEQDDAGRTAGRLTRLSDADLMDGDVTLAVRASAVNFKDGLAVTGRLPVVRRWPMVPGVDVAATVMGSDDPRWQLGRRGDPDRLGHRRDASRRLVREDARLGRLAGPPARDAVAGGRDGARHRRPHRRRRARQTGIVSASRPADGPVVVTGRGRRRRLPGGHAAGAARGGASPR